MSPEEKLKTGQEIMADIRQEFINQLDSKNALDKAAEVLIQEIEAFETKAFNANGEIIYSEPLIAHGPRLKAIELLTQIYGLKAPEKHEVSGAVTVMKPDLIRKPKNSGKSKNV